VGEEGLRAFERITAAKPVVELFGECAPETVAAASALPFMGLREPGPASMALPDDARRAAPQPAPSSAPAAPRPVPPASVARPNRGAPYHERVAATLIAQLEAGTAPWQQTWAPGALQLPHNPVSGTRYRGANALWLAMQGREDPRWMTYEQARRLQAQVRHGERGTQVQFWKLRDRMPVQDDRGQPVRDAEGKPVYRTIQLDRPKVFTAVVFNAEQIDGLPPLEVTAPAPDRHMRAEALLKASGADIRHDQGEHLF
jgi:antirestriction protein ArdC